MPFPKFLSSSSSRRKKDPSTAEEEKASKKEKEDDSQGLPDCCWLRSLSFEDILEKPGLNGAFRQFLEARPGHRAFAFWSEIRSFKCVSSQNETLSIDSGYNASSSECPSPQRSDALRIYQKFVSPEGSSYVPLPSEVAHRIIKGICTEKPSVDPECFTPAENFLYSSLSNEDFSEFLRSSHYAKYLLEGSGPTSISDILSNEALLCRFTEFLEAEGDKDTLSFWMAVNHFHEQSEALQGDALVIYEKYISMQAYQPLGFSNQVRSQIEEQICVHSGPLNPHLFDNALRIVVQSLNNKYLVPFLQSSLFQNYISELKSTIYSSSSLSPSKSSSWNRAPSLKGKRSASVSSLASSCSDISTHNTLLAMSRPHHPHRLPKSKSDINGKILHNVDSCSLNMDPSWDPNHIWRSMNSLSSSSSSCRRHNIGEIDHLGRYISHFESLPPASSALSQTAPSSSSPSSSSFVGDPLIRSNGNSKLHRVMRVLGVGGSEIPQVQEQLAWHEAEIIVKDILNLSSGSHPSTSSSLCDRSLDLKSEPH